MSRRQLWIIAFAAGLPAAAIAWWLGSPLFLDRTVHEEFPHAASATIPPGLTRSEVESVMAGMAKLDRPVVEAMPGWRQPVVMKQGPFRDADSFHKGSGRATVYALPDGRRVLRFEDFRVTNGPDLRVVISSHPGPSDREDLETAGYVDLGGLKGNVGGQNYELPATLDVGAQRSVVIYCRAFHVVFSVAALS